MLAKRTNCTFCSLGCSLLIQVEGKRVIAQDYDLESNVNHGALCPRGNYMYELLTNPNRLELPRIRENKVLRTVSHDESIAFSVKKLAEIKKAHGAQSIGIVLGSDLFNEDIYAAYKLFKEAIGTPNIDVALPAEDQALLAGNDRVTTCDCRESSLDDIANSDALIIIGDILTRSPVMSYRINNVKYVNKGKIIVIDPERSHSAWFATSHLQVKPGLESKLLSGIIKYLIDNGIGKSGKLKKYFANIDIQAISEETGVPSDAIARAAREFSDAKKGSVLIVSGFRDKLIAELSKILANVSPGDKRTISFYSSGNAIGAHKTINSLRRGKGLTSSEMIDEAARGRIKALVLFRWDPVKSAMDEKTMRALYNLKFLSVTDLYRTQVMDYADVLRPLATTLEGRGSLSFSGRRLTEIDPVVPPAGGLFVSNIALRILKLIKGGGKLPTERELYLEARKMLRSYKTREKFSISSLHEELKEVKPIRDSEKFPLRIYVKDDIVHSGDGSITARHFWANRECASPYAEVNFLDARRYRVSDGGRVLLKTAAGEIILSARVVSSIPSGVVALPHHFQEIRELMQKEKDEALRNYALSPSRAMIEGLG